MRAAAAVLLLHIAHAKAPDHHHDYALNATLTHPIELACLKQVRLRGDLGLAPADRSLYSYNPSVRRVDGGYLYLARVTNLHGCDAARAARPATVVDGLFALALLDDGLSIVPRSVLLMISHRSAAVISAPAKATTLGSGRKAPRISTTSKE